MTLKRSPKMDGKTPFMIQMPKRLHSDLTETAARLNVNKSSFIREAIARHVMSFRHWLIEQEKQADRAL